MIKLFKYSYLLLLIFSISLMIGCGPESISTEEENLQSSSKTWIPYTGSEQLVFVFEDDEIVFTSEGKETYFDNIRYMSDQSGFFKIQEDYFADLERQILEFTSPSTPYSIQYFLERNKGDTGDWDILRVMVNDGDEYKNEMKIVIYETDNFDKGERYKYTRRKTIGGTVFDSVYYYTQTQRPFEIYYTQKQGIVAFQPSTNETWVLKQDTATIK